MSKKTFFDAIKPHILEKGDEPSIEEFKELAEKTDTIGEEFADDSEWVFESVPLDRYYLTANPYNVVAEREALTEMIKRNDDIAYVPTYMIEKPKALKKLFNAVIVEDKIYSRQHNDITKTQDTERYLLKEDCYHVMRGGYYEFNDNLVRCGNEDKWAHKKDTVITADMGYRWYKNDCYKYRDDDGNTEYYRYRNMAPNAGRRILRFDESIFPDPDDLNEARLGIELEYISAIDASVSVLTDEDLRTKWSSVRDGSLVQDGIPRDQEKSTEFVSIPFTINEVGREVKKMMAKCERQGAKINKECGFHVHIGSPKLDFKSLTGLVLLCENIENELFRLVPDHRQNNEYCAKIDSSFDGFEKHLTEGLSEEKVAEKFYEGMATADSRKNQTKWNVRHKRHYWVSVDRYWYCKDEPHKRTVEFRMHHATHNSEEFLQFVYLCYYIAQFAFNNSVKDCRNADLADIIDTIKNHEHLEKVQNLLQSKKVIVNQ